MIVQDVERDIRGPPIHIGIVEPHTSVKFDWYPHGWSLVRQYSCPDVKQAQAVVDVKLVSRPGLAFAEEDKAAKFSGLL